MVTCVRVGCMCVAACVRVRNTCVLRIFSKWMFFLGGTQVRLAAGHKFDRDVELLIYYKDAHQPTAVVEAGQESGKAGN